jgi:hypothetical protein
VATPGARVASPGAGGLVYSRRRPELGTLYRVVRENVRTLYAAGVEITAPLSVTEMGFSLHAATRAGDGRARSARGGQGGLSVPESRGTPRTPVVVRLCASTSFSRR